jgi:CRP-like cAMP-binding protein
MKETLIRNAPLFSALDTDEQHEISKVMKELSVAKGETLFSQGQPIQRMFLIETGWVKQSTQLETGRTLVNNLGPGSLVGEMDMLLEEPSASSAAANSDLKAWTLIQADLNQVLDESPRIGLKLSAALGSRIKQVDRYLVHQRLRTTALFSELSDDSLNAIADRLQPMEIRRGGLIFRAGAPGDAIFLIEDGEVSLTSTAEETGEPFRTLGAGDVLGEMAVLAGKPYDGLARAATEVVLWVLRREDFIAVATRFPEVRVSMSGRLSQPLSPEDRALASRQLARLRLFADVPAAATQAVSGVLVLRHYPAGERLFQAGDPGDSMFFVDSGQIRLEDAEGAERALLPGDQYGENCLLTGKSRVETAIADLDSNVWILYSSDFDELLARFPVLGSALSKAVGGYLVSTNSIFLDNQLRHIPLFAELEPVELSEVANALHQTQANRGDVVFAEGQRGDAIYFIESGEVQLGTRVGDSYQMTFERMIAGDFFGELALLADSPRTSTARAVVNDTQLWALYKADFDRIAVQYPQVAQTLSRVLGERLARTSSTPLAPRALAPRRPQVKPPSGGGASTGARPVVAKPKVVPTTSGNGQRNPKARQAGNAAPLSNSAKPATPKPASHGSKQSTGHTPDSARKSHLPVSDDLTPSVRPTEDITPPSNGHSPNGNGRQALGHGHAPGNGSGYAPGTNNGHTADSSHLTIAARPASDRPSPTTGARPLAARPSSVPVIKRPSATPPPPPAGQHASPLSVKPPVPARPQSRPVPKRPPAPLIQPKPRATPRAASASIAQANASSAQPRAAGMPQAYAVPSRPRRAPIPQTRTVAPRPVRRDQQLAVRTQQYDPVTLAVFDSVKWAMARSAGFKFRMVALSMLFVWLCGITAPVAALSALAIQNNGGKVALGGVSVNIGNDAGPRPQVAALAATFTATPPPTAVPTKGATAQASPTTRVVVAQAIATNTAVPTARPRPTVSPTPAGPVVASVPVPAVDFKITSVRPLTPCENQGNHNVYVLVLDQQGNGIPNISVEFDYGNGKLVDRTGRKAENIPSLGVNPRMTAGFLDWPSYKNTTRVRVVSGSSEQTEGLRVDLPDQRCDKNDNPIGNSTYHYSYLVVFQKMN